MSLVTELIYAYTRCLDHYGSAKVVVISLTREGVEELKKEFPKAKKNYETGKPLWYKPPEGFDFFLDIQEYHLYFFGRK